MKKHAIILSAMLCSGAYADDRLSTYDMVEEAKWCWADTSKIMSCDYEIGKTLRVRLTGIGQPDINIAYMKSYSDGDFYASYGLDHGCVIVKPGLYENEEQQYSGMAFIQPKNGKVYKAWEECKTGL